MMFKWFVLVETWLKIMTYFRKTYNVDLILKNLFIISLIDFFPGK